MHLRVYLFLHVVVLVLCLQRHRTLAIFLVHRSHHVGYCALAILKSLTVVVAYYVVHMCTLHVALHTQQMEESLITLSRLRSLVLRQQPGQLHCQHVGVHHLALGIARMHAHALYIHLSAGSVEVLKLQFAHVASIHRVGPFASELLHIKVVCAHTYLLVRVKRHAYVAVLYLLMIAQIAHRLHYLCYSGLVVGPQQRCTVSHYQVLACVL